MAHIGHPLISDFKYGPQSVGVRNWQIEQCARLFLHAARISIMTPTTATASTTTSTSTMTAANNADLNADVVDPADPAATTATTTATVTATVTTTDATTSESASKPLSSREQGKLAREEKKLAINLERERRNAILLAKVTSEVEFDVASPLPPDLVAAMADMEVVHTSAFDLDVAIKNDLQ